MTDYQSRIEEMQRRRIIAMHAPSASKMYREASNTPQRELARGCGCHATMISALENGKITSWIVAEAVIILAGLPLAEYGIAETPGLRDRLDRYLRDGTPINHTIPELA